MLDFFCDLAQLKDPVLTYDGLMEMPPAAREAWIEAGLIRQWHNASGVVCDGCYEGHSEEVVRVTYSNGDTRLYIYCPESGQVEVDPERLQQWVPDYSRVAAALAEALCCTGTLQEVVPDRLWNLGRAAIARQSRPVWLARQITDDLRPRLPTDRVSILFVMGMMPRVPLELAPERVFDLRHLVTIEGGGLRFDTEAVTGQVTVAATAAEPAPPRAEKRASRVTAIDRLKKALHEEILSRKSLLSRRWDDNLPPVQQKHLAALIGTSPASVYRALKDDDRELQWLWKIVQNPRHIMDYRG